MGPKNPYFLEINFMILGLLFEVYLRVFGARILSGLETLFLGGKKKVSSFMF
jgi:hypothetical protein